MLIHSKVHTKLSLQQINLKGILASEMDIIHSTAGVVIQEPVDATMDSQKNPEGPGTISPTGPEDSTIASQAILKGPANQTQSSSGPR